MSDNPEFDKALKERMGEVGYALLFCSCGKELIECPHCHKMLCPDGCEQDSDNCKIRKKVI